MTDDNPIKRWTAKRRASVDMDIFKGKITAVEVARQYDLTVSEVEGWMGEAQRSMETRSGLARRTSASTTNLHSCE